MTKGHYSESGAAPPIPKNIQNCVEISKSRDSQKLALFCTLTVASCSHGTSELKLRRLHLSLFTQKINYSHYRGLSKKSKFVDLKV
jgi:hypothetical protein